MLMHPYQRSAEYSRRGRGKSARSILWSGARRAWVREYGMYTQADGRTVYYMQQHNTCNSYHSEKQKRSALSFCLSHNIPGVLFMANKASRIFQRSNLKMQPGYVHLIPGMILRSVCHCGQILRVVAISRRTSTQDHILCIPQFTQVSERKWSGWGISKPP